ncbi:tetratricopeptide repeat protein [Glacieibacterium sp.]|uniref:tetratricopeptide repeat protein n=1 Tax=Glacieibacterium sp. TaxID=2860237 RepID=UPI003B007A31
MANTGDTDDSFIREVDEEYRRDQLSSFWRRYGRWLVIGVAVLLIALGGWLWWKSEQAREAGIDGEQFNLALTKLETGNTPDAVPILDKLAAGKTGGYATLARLMQAANAVQAGDNGKAVTLYNAIAADTSEPQPFRDLATIKATRLEFDTLTPAAIVERMKPLSVPGNPWFGVAGEMRAIAYLRDNKAPLAAPLLAGIAADISVPPTLRNRAQQLAATIGQGVTTPAPATAAATPAAPPAAAPAAATPGAK